MKGEQSIGQRLRRAPVGSVRRAAGILAVAAGILVVLPLVLRPVRAAQAADAVRTGHSPQAATYTLLYEFGGEPDGSMPGASLIVDSAGNFYGTTSEGGAYGYGAIYELPATGSETVLYSFTGGSDGALPWAPLLRDTAGNLYGTAVQGGIFNDTCPVGCGVVFKLSPRGKETVLYSFTGGTDGQHPISNLVRDSAGNLYGSAAFGGIPGLCVGFGGIGGCGVIFKVTKAGSETPLYSFTGGADGANPGFDLTRDSAGNLYGVASAGGNITGLCTNGCGVVFRLDAAGNETVLNTFTGGPDGFGPVSGVIFDSAGNLYGTAELGGNEDCGVSGFGCGVVFKLDPSGNETVLHTFTGADGECPTGLLVRDALGNLYGTTRLGGANANGAVFQLNVSGKETVLHSFTFSDGAKPFSGLSPYKGVLYGTASVGGLGAGENGVVFKIVP